MQGRTIVGLGIGLVVAVSCWLVPSKVLALTNEEMVRQLDERFIKGEIPADLYRELRKKYTGGGSTPQAQAAPARPVKEPKGNLLKNFSMEEDSDSNKIPDSWQVYRHPDASRPFVVVLDSQVNHSGDKSVRFEFNSEQCYGGITQTIKTEPGKKYLISCWLKGQNMKGSDAFILQASAHPNELVAGMVEGKKLVKGTRVVSKAFYGAKGTFDWRRMVAKTEPVPEGMQYLRIYLRHYNPAANSTEWIDDFVVVPVD